jgi:hypothetical protein
VSSIYDLRGLKELRCPECGTIYQRQPSGKWTRKNWIISAVLVLAAASIPHFALAYVFRGAWPGTFQWIMTYRLSIAPLELLYLPDCRQCVYCGCLHNSGRERFGFSDRYHRSLALAASDHSHVCHRRDAAMTPELT